MKWIPDKTNPCDEEVLKSLAKYGYGSNELNVACKHILKIDGMGNVRFFTQKLELTELDYVGVRYGKEYIPKSWLTNLTVRKYDVDNGEYFVLALDCLSDLAKQALLNTVLSDKGTELSEFIAKARVIKTCTTQIEALIEGGGVNG